MKRLGLLGLLLGSAFGLVLLVSACAGPAGTAGPTGATGAQGRAGPVGPAAATPAGDGLVLKITKVDIGTDLRPVVSFTLTDAKGNPLDMAVLDANSPRFTIAKIAADGSQYVNYIINTVQGAPYTVNGVTKQPALATATQPAMDTGGTFTTVKAGTYTYQMKTVLGADYDKSATNAVGGQASRNNRVVASNDVFYFIPAGTPTVMRQIVNQASCNQCHDPLVKHGSRIDTRLCVLCHTPQNMDPLSGGTFDFKVFIHRIHDGSQLPSVLAGGHDTIYSGTTLEDYTNITFPQNIKNCTTCHGAPPTGMKPEDYAKLAPQANNYMNNPNRAACGSCHDDVNFVTGANHPGGSQTDDKQCKICHQPNGSEFDASVVGAHTIPERSKTLKGVNFKIIAASVLPGQKASVDFSIADNSGAPIDPNKMDSLSVTMAWPTTDLAQRTNETINTIPAAGAAPFVRPGTLTDLGGGTWRYTTGLTIDPSWNTGSAELGLQGAKKTAMKINLGKDYVVSESNVNPVTYVSVVAGQPAVARRLVVDRDKCNACHLDLGSPAGVSIHGGSRRNPNYCVMCHNATFTDGTQSLKFGYFIHTIHAGSTRAAATTIAGIKTQDIRFPGNLQDCLKCHIAGTYGLPLKDGISPSIFTATGATTPTKIQPITAVCSGCHTGKDTFDAHAAIMTSPANIEACPSCHGVGKAFDVNTVHVVH